MIGICSFWVMFVYVQLYFIFIEILSFFADMSLSSRWITRNYQAHTHRSRMDFVLSSICLMKQFDMNIIIYRPFVWPHTNTHLCSLDLWINHSDWCVKRMDIYKLWHFPLHQFAWCIIIVQTAITNSNSWMWWVANAPTAIEYVNERTPLNGMRFSTQHARIHEKPQFANLPFSLWLGLHHFQSHQKGDVC